jgi:hypothetical protein
MLVDYHHHDLWESLELLCARLGWDLYRPMGMDWFEQEYWNFERAWHGDSVAKQYLEPWDSDQVWEPTGTLDLTQGLGPDPTKGHRVRWDASHERWINLLTLEQARDLRPNIVMASVAHNHEGLHRFAQEVGAKFGLHLGNVRFSPIDMAEDRWDLADFGIVTSVLPAPVDKPHVVVHQEFSLEDFRHEDPPDGFRVSSFVNCFPENYVAYEGWRQVASQRPDYDWRVYGAYGSVTEDQWAAGNIDKCSAVGDAMRASHVAWHTKQWSDGFGHVVHNWFSVGRPVIGHQWYYENQLAGPLWQEGETSFDISNRTTDEVVSLIDRLHGDPDLRLRMGENAARRFREVVNFDEEEQQIRRMFEAVL